MSLKLAMSSGGAFAQCLLLALLFLLSLLLLRLRFKKKSSISKSRPPSPPELPIIGNLHQLSKPLHLSLHSLSKKHGPLMHLRLGQITTIIVSSAEAAQEIMRAQDAIFASRPPIKAARITGARNVAFSPYGEQWRLMKKLCTVHLLTAKMVHSFQGVREQEVATLIAEISSKGSAVIDVSEVLNVFTNRIICRIVLGDSFCRDEEKNKMFCQMVEEFAVFVGELAVGDCFPSLGWLDVVTGFERRGKRIARRWDAVLDAVIDDHAKEYGDNKDVANRSNDFVDVLLTLQNDPTMDFVLSRENIKALLMDMIAAGTDTSFIALEWCITELIHNPKVMKKLKDEVQGTGKRGHILTEEDISKMGYIKLVIKEVLRLHPPLPLLLPRESLENCRVKGYEIPMNTRVIINAWGIGRDPTLWETPEEFSPDRFLGTSIDFKGKDFQFIPFGAGRRSCPGIQFAIPTLELGLANIVNQFDLKLPEHMKLTDVDMTEAPGATSRKKQKLYLVAEKT